MDCAVHWTVSLCWKVRLSATLSGHKSFSRASAWEMRPSHVAFGQSEVSVLPNRARPQQGFSHIRARNVEPVSVYNTQRVRYSEESTWNDRKRDKLPYLEKTGLMSLCVCVCVCVCVCGMDAFVFIPQNHRRVSSAYALKRFFTAMPQKNHFGSTKNHSVKGSLKNHLFLTFL